ncbi:uncharacterized protein LOC133294837 [Gastrolobium bilobum]|uniref:uncharacterized protein LOC133294837 n=1 Tax=Gastrolobium bilobum TaxID=150636 RepID=UPI002AB10F9E|nr:uncharacterized protein LOC133294837 [Gastrolobium bilobum]
MGKPSTVQRSLVHFWVLLVLVVSFCYAISAAATTEVSGKEMDSGKYFYNHGWPKARLEDEEEAKSEQVFHPKPTFKRPYFKKPSTTVKKPPKALQPAPVVKGPTFPHHPPKPQDSMVP